MLAATDPVQLLETWWVVASIVLPFLFPVFVKAGAAPWFKMVVSLGLSVGIAAVSIAGMDWGDITAELVVNRAFVAIGIVQTVYQVSNRLVAGWLDEHGKGLESAPIYPERIRNVGIGSTKGA